MTYSALLAATAGIGGAYLHYRHVRDSAVARLQEENEALRARQAELEAIVTRLKASRRLAQVVVTRQKRDDRGRALETSLALFELTADGQNVLRRQDFTIPGEVAFFDALVIKFDAESVSAGDPLRGHTIALLRRIYSETQPPQTGQPIDEPGRIPDIYRTAEASPDFQENLWRRFWTLATDPAAAAEAGVRVAQGEAVYKPLRPGVLYLLTLDAIGGLNLETRPLVEAAPEVLLAVGRAEGQEP